MAKILVIDDDQDILRLLEFALKRAGHTVTVKLDGVQGLAEAETAQPDLIVCDVMMPKMTGYEFCKQARSKPALKETPIIVFSARFQPIDRQTALDAGATEYLAKTAAPDVLVNRIEELLPKSETSTPTTHGMIGVFSLRGGAGVTALAVNLSIALALIHKTNPALIDLAVLGGHSALMLGLRPTSSVAKLLSAGDGFSPETLQPHLAEHSSGVRLLSSPPAFGGAIPPQDRLFTLMQSLKATFAITVLDVPFMLSPTFKPIVALLNKIVLVVSPDMPSVQSTVVAIQGLTTLGVSDDKILLILNQTIPQNTLPVQTIQKVVKRPIKTAIPFDANMVSAVNSGKPILLNQPQSPASVAIGKLANTLL